MNVAWSYVARLLLVSGLCFAPTHLVAADAAPNTLSDAEKQESWQLLFDGQTTGAWRNYKKETIGPGWQIVDGALTRADKGAGDIITDAKFTAFDLTLDYNISEGGNSGLMYHVDETEKTPWMTGPEVQIQDNAKGHDPQLAGWLYQLYKSETDATKPAGQWNTLRIRITPTKCEQWMNGVKYCEYVKGSDDWNAKVAASKFAAFPNFGKPLTGHICLQDHGNRVAFRNIKIRKLD